MSIKNSSEIKVGDAVYYYNHVSHTDRIGKVCGPPSCIQEVQANYVWCNFDDENVPEAINLTRTILIKFPPPADLTIKKDSDSPEINKKMTCSHPAESVVISYIGFGVSAVKYRYCRNCKGDLGNV